jgi:hypothetical protein
MPILRRATVSKCLASGALALPLILAACLPSRSTGSDDSPEQNSGAVVTENANDKVAFDYFVGQGLTDVQAAGIVGNLDQESGMSPTIAQIGGGPGRGIAQWSVGGRWDTSQDDNVAWYAAQQGESVDSLDLQLSFIWYELTTIGYGYSELRAATTVDEAVTVFQDDYEICGACDSSNRIAYAEAALAQFGGAAPPPPAGNTSCAVGGVDGMCIATSTCAAMTGYTSTPGFCPGAANIECCTPTGGSSTSGSSGATSGAGSSGSGSGSGTSGAGGAGSSGSGSGSATSGAGGGSSSGSGGSGGGGGSGCGGAGNEPPSCNVDGVDGTCIDTGTCASMTGYTSTPGYCPGAANIECCTPPPSCNADGVSGVCIDTSVCAAAGGTSTPGLCPGAASEECCTQ